jgi:hypothetical protein
MTRFSDEVRIIPATAWIIAAFVEVAMFCILLFAVIPKDPKLREWPGIGAVAFSIWPGLLLAMLVLLIGYINADARRRGMRYVLWTLLAIFLPNSIGIILYFVMRDPLLTPCAKCGSPARPGFAFCPQCGSSLSTGCPACKRAVEPDWQRCPYCGAALKPASPAPALGTAKA